MKKEKIVIANFKMNPISQKEVLLISKEVNSFKMKLKNTKIVLCPPVLFIPEINKSFKNKKFFIGSQNSFYESTGAFTGEVSAQMLSHFNVKYFILGHSERREFGESNYFINQKIKNVLILGMFPVLCVGEKERDENHQYLNFLQNQIEESLAGVPKSKIENLIIAYEPIWAIGKNAKREASEEEIREIFIFIKKILTDKFGFANSKKVKIIYGGSVNSQNINHLSTIDLIDGFLVGRDSLDSKKFLEIVKVIEKNAIN